MRYVLFLLTSLILSGCSYYTQTVMFENTTGNITTSTTSASDQGRKGADSLIPFSGVQANVPLNGGTVSNPTNTPNIVTNPTK